MTRKHFEAIAHVLDANIVDLAIVSDFADMLEESNPRFDRLTFVQASTVNLRKRWASDQRIMEKGLA